jgi:ZIP family zinc transporter
VSVLIQMLVLTTAAGACILAGGLLARVENIRPRWLETEFRHSVIAFGGGVLVSAVALVLVPEGNRAMDSVLWSCLVFLAGGVAFCWLEITLHRFGGEKPQFSAMLLDYLPESLALGGLFATGSSAAPLLALMIGLQNLPEGFNAYRELTAHNPASVRRTLLLMAAVIPLGPMFGLVGWAISGVHPGFLGGAMLFAAGGILYLLFQDIAPQARLARRWAPTLGAVLGFGLGLLGDLLVET